MTNNVLEKFKEFEVCGTKLRFRAMIEENRIDPQVVIESFNNELNKQRAKFPQSQNEQLFLLTALSVIEENLILKRSLKQEMDSLYNTTQNTLTLIEDLLTKQDTFQ